MIIFIENLAGIEIASRSPALTKRWSIKFIRSSITPWTSQELRRNGPVIPMPPSVLRWLKLITGLLQFPIVQQDPTALAFRLNAWRRILSDGLLTEFLVDELHLPVREMHSILSCGIDDVPVVTERAIVGSNWFEFGTMSEARYVQHLEFLNSCFPEARYYCHPREASQHPNRVFGLERAIRPGEPLESFLRKRGIPNELIGVCSSSLLALPARANSRVSVRLITLADRYLDGRMGDTIEVLKTPINGTSRIRIHDLQRFLIRRLQDHDVPLQVIKQDCL